MRRLPAEEMRLAASGIALAVLLAALGASLVAEKRGEAGRIASAELNRLLVGELALTDLALWSEAAYCRHPTQTDGFSAWSDHPGAPEHFPAGSLVPPPQMITAGIDRGRVAP